jgi:imidazole glycerol-phosphate synthase subunit HisF
MLAKRIIPCLDIRDGRTVKGVNFENIIDAGSPVELAARYEKEGADELVFLDITATVEKRKTFTKLVTGIAEVLSIPFTVGGGISCIDDIKLLLDSGADKVSINSAAVRNPNTVNELANTFGSQCIVVAIDAKCTNGEWKVYVDGGRTETDKDAFEWAKECESRGAGEILLTSMNNDGVKGGFAVAITSKIASELRIPVIASGGAGTMEHFKDVFITGNADAALAASVFHFKEISIRALKEYLEKEGIDIRL